MAAAKRTTKTHKYAKPKHKHTKDYLKVYWPYMPLAIIVVMILAILSPLTMIRQRGVLAYATDVNSEGLLSATNKQRVGNGREPLALNEKLSEAAAAKAQDMVARNYWSHNTPENNAPWIFITKTGYEYQKAGENLAYGFNSSNETVTGWMNSATHRANVLDSLFTDVGFGFADSDNYVGKGPSTIVVAMYGRPTSLPVIASTLAEEQPQVKQTSVTNQQQTIGVAQILTRGYAPWIMYSVMFVLGASLMYLLLKHSWQLKKAIKNSEKFVINHPLLDATLVGVIVLSMLLVQKSGVIL